MNTQRIDPDLVDFPSSQHGSDSAHQYYATFTAAQALADQLPRVKGVSTLEVVRTLMREVRTSSTQQKALFRKHANAEKATATYWISRCRHLAKVLIALTPEFPPFRGLSKDHLAGIAKLSIDPSELPSLPGILREWGVVLLFEPAVPGMKVDGAAFRLENGSPVIALSLRHNRLDNFWFTLMHELAHVVLHYDRLGTPIMDDIEEPPVDLIEQQADRLGTDALVPRSDWRGNDVVYKPTLEGVLHFSRTVGVHPAIIAGRARRELANYSLFNEIVHEVNVRKVFFNEE